MAHWVEVHSLALCWRQQDVPLGTLEHGDEIASSVVVVFGNDAAVAEAAVDALTGVTSLARVHNTHLVHVRLVDEEALGRLERRQVLGDPFAVVEMDGNARKA